MVKLSILIKGIVLYMIFILGISMMSEWWESRKAGSQIDIKLDIYLKSIKDEIMKKMAKENFNSEIESELIQIPENLHISEEDKIIKEVNDRLMYSNQFNYKGNDSSAYSNLFNENNIELASKSNFNYEGVTQDFNNQQQYIPKYTRYPIENATYRY